MRGQRGDVRVPTGSMRPLVGRQLAADDVEERGLAGAVRANQRVTRARLHGERHLVYCLEAAKVAGYAIKLQASRRHFFGVVGSDDVRLRSVDHDPRLADRHSTIVN